MREVVAAPVRSGCETLVVWLPAGRGAAAPEVDWVMHSPAKHDATEGRRPVAPRPVVTLAMTWWEKWAFNLLHGLVAVTGIAYFYMKYLVASTDPFAVVNHPWQSSMLAWHLVAAPFFVVFFGMLFRTHTLRKLLSASPRNRWSGWTSLVGFSVMALTGYLIQVASSPAWITAWIGTHVAASAIFVVGYTTHMVIGWRLGRSSAMRPDTLHPAAPLSP